jgi:hypothetical protein
MPFLMPYTSLIGATSESDLGHMGLMAGRAVVAVLFISSAVFWILLYMVDGGPCRCGRAVHQLCGVLDFVVGVGVIEVEVIVSFFGGQLRSEVGSSKNTKKNRKSFQKILVLPIRP